jgi:hypothetical protein
VISGVDIEDSFQLKGSVYSFTPHGASELRH